jgi:hypothetical protein
MKYEITSNQFDRLASLEYDLRILATDAADSKYIHAKAMNTLATELRALVMRIEMQDVED